MTPRPFVPLFLCVLCASAVNLLAAPPPNFIILLADDLGYGDLSCYGSKEISTPRLDQMARDGTRFTDFYVAAPFCSPSRAALLTGRLPARCGVPYVLFPAEHTGLPPDEITIAKLLKDHGYATACIGKWHLGWDKPFRPQNHGFDTFFGLPYANDSREWPIGQPFTQVMGLQPLPLIDANRIIEAPVDQSTLTKRYTERSVAFIRENKDHPFFLYLAHTMPHIPQYASKDFAGKSKAGIYGDAVEEIDWSTGVILDTLRDLHLSDRTLVIFTSDNGAPLVNRAAAGKKKKSGPFGEHANGGSNAPLRGAKGQTYEGGIRMPAIACWPGHVPPARTSPAITSTMDLLPTFAALAGAPLPPDHPLDGQDISPTLLGTAAPDALTDRTLFHYFGYQLQAIRQGPWKLFVPIHDYPTPMPPSLWFTHSPEVFKRQHRLWPNPTLYDLSHDIAESKDVAAEHPDIVDRLIRVAKDFDAQLPKRPMLLLPGPQPPKPNQIRQPADDLSAWHNPN